jgi:hypothetical protein
VSASKKSERRSALSPGKDSVVGRLVDTATERQRENTQNSPGRGRPGHGGELGLDGRGRAKATYDLSLDRQALVREMAEAENVAQSDIIEAAIVLLHNARQAGLVDLHDLKRPARSLKADWKLEIPDEFGSKLE